MPDPLLPPTERAAGVDRGMRWRDLLERVAWTAVAAGLASVPAVAVLNVAAWQAAGVVGLTAAVNAVTVIARWRLAQLPDPGAGLPGLPT